MNKESLGGNTMHRMIKITVVVIAALITNMCLAATPAQVGKARVATPAGVTVPADKRAISVDFVGQPRPAAVKARAVNKNVYIRTNRVPNAPAVRVNRAVRP